MRITTRGWVVIFAIAFCVGFFLPETLPWTGLDLR
jgi:hypothetical protein